MKCIYYKAVKISSETAFTFCTCCVNFKINNAVGVGTETLPSCIIQRGSSFLNKHLCPLREQKEFNITVRKREGCKMLKMRKVTGKQIICYQYVYSKIIWKLHCFFDIIYFAVFLHLNINSAFLAHLNFQWFSSP